MILTGCFRDARGLAARCTQVQYAQDDPSKVKYSIEFKKLEGSWAPDVSDNLWQHN